MCDKFKFVRPVALEVLRDYERQLDAVRDGVAVRAEEYPETMWTRRAGAS